MKPTLYLPIEIKVRELSAKTLLALTAAKGGFRVYLGSKSAVDRLVYEKEGRGGIYLYKGGKRLEDLTRVKRKIDYFVVLDEEMGPAVRDLDRAYRGRIYPDTEALIDKVLLVSEEHRDAISRVRPLLATKAVVTGWPRIDLWKSKFKSRCSETVVKIRRTYGDFLIFSSDFGILSDQDIKSEIESMREGGYSKADIDNSRASMIATCREFEDFIILIKKIDGDARFPRLIIRPHPSEDIRIWKDLLRGMERVEVVYSGEIDPWLYASKGLLHRGCTTAVQAYMAGIPTICVVSKYSPQNRDSLPYIVSWSASNYARLLSLSTSAFEGRLPRKVDIDISRKIYISHISSSESIVDELRLMRPNGEPRYETNVIERRLRFLRTRLKNIYLSKFRVLADPRIRGRNNKLQGGIHRREVLMLSNALMPNHGLSIIERSFNLIEIDAHDSGRSDADGI